MVFNTMVRRKGKRPPVHPGEILLEEFLKPLGITQYRLAKTIGVAQRRIGEIVQGNRGITADTALRLARALRTTPQFWMNLQSRYDLECLGDVLNDDLDKSIKPLVA